MTRNNYPKPAALVVGQFRLDNGNQGFAYEAWQKITEIHERNYWHSGKWHKSTTREVHRHIGGGEPLLKPIQLDDGGDAGSLAFRQRLYQEFKTFNISGVISCCTAENSSKLLATLEPIDVPILIALDNTVERSALTQPNVLQLIPNNALQAQAILSKVGAALPPGDDKVTVNVYLWPPQNDFVRDLWKALQDKVSEAQNSRINLNQISVGNTLREVGSSLNEKDVFVYVGYYDGLAKVIDMVKTEKLILSDACYESRVEELMKHAGRSYYLARPSFDPSVYACQGYLGLSKVWIESLRRSDDWLLSDRMQSPAILLRSRMETLFSSYRFVGATNQSGGYIVRKSDLQSKDSGEQ